MHGNIIRFLMAQGTKTRIDPGAVSTRYCRSSLWVFSVLALQPASMNFQFQAILLIFLSSATTMLVLVLLVYAIALLVDRLSCLNTSLLTAEEVQERRRASNMMRETGLAGMLSPERSQVFRTFFDNRSMPYHKQVEETEAQDIESQDPGTKGNSKKGSTRTDRPALLESDDCTSDDVATAEPEEGTETNNLSCSICLNEYNDGDKVITGTACTHIFHFDCCMQWIEKGHDHCPYCRELVLTAEELVEASRATLGNERVDKLIRINEEAAARIAEFEQRVGNTTRRNPVEASSTHPPPVLQTEAATAENATPIQETTSDGRVSPSPPGNGSEAGCDDEGNEQDVADATDADQNDEEQQEESSAQAEEHEAREELCTVSTTFGAEHMDGNVEEPQEVISAQAMAEEAGSREALCTASTSRDIESGVGTDVVPGDGSVEEHQKEMSTKTMGEEPAREPSGVSTGKCVEG